MRAQVDQMQAKIILFLEARKRGARAPTILKFLNDDLDGLLPLSLEKINPKLTSLVERNWLTKTKGVYRLTKDGSLAIEMARIIATLMQETDRRADLIRSRIRQRIREQILN